MSACPYCTETAPDGEACYQPHGDLVCTRAPGHNGPHVACGDEHQIETWEGSGSITDRARAEARDRYRIQRMEPVQTLSEHKMEAFTEGAEWAVSQPVTDEEVKVAAWAICRLQDDGYEPTEDHPCRACTEAARAALTAAREAQR